jgi:hypothetical protein
MPNAQANIGWLNANSDPTAEAKKASSSISRTTPGTGIGAFPDLLGSFGTANVPQIAAAIIGIANARTTLKAPSS